MEKTCSRTDCDYAASGVCLDQLGETCANLQEQVTEIAPASIVKSTDKIFHTGEKLSAAEASRLLNAIPARVILCAGTQDAGKTTFLARLGEIFRAGSFVKHRFAKSFTLLGFERATWHATLNSETGGPDTERTSRSENDHFLHLRVRSVSAAKETTDLLISDLSGESFRDAVASKGFCTEQLALMRADSICLFLDSWTLANKRLRHGEQDNAVNFLNRVIEVVNPLRVPHINIVFSRWDKLLNAGMPEKHVTFCKELEDVFRQKFEALVRSISFHRVAARPQSGKPTDDEVQKVFETWVNLPKAKSVDVWSRCLNPGRDFCAFGLS